MNENNLIYFHIIIILLQEYTMGNERGSNVCRWAGSILLAWGCCWSWGMPMLSGMNDAAWPAKANGKGYCRGRDNT